MILGTELFAGRYRLVRLVGQGGMSDVYEAVDEHAGERVALKVVRSHDPECARRLAQEVRALRRTADPGLIGMRDAGMESDQAYLVMDFVEGPTLAEALRSGALSPAQTAGHGASLARALLHVHAQGIVHRDVKPSNVLLTHDGQARLGDFGIARLMDAATFTMEGTTLGTVAYMAPEQLEDHDVGPGADIWSLGMVLLECLTGQRVYEGTGSAIVARRLAGPVPLPADLPVTWKLLVSGMLDHRPAERLSAAEVAALLASGAFGAPWERDAAAPADVTALMDLTALTPRAVGEGVRAASGTTVVASPVAVAGTTPGGDTGTAVPAPTRVGMPPPSGSRGVAVRPRRPRWAWGALLLAAALGLGLAAGATLHTGPAAAPAAHRQGSTTTTTPPPTTTTTVAPSPASTLGTLFGDLTAGVDGGTVVESDARMIGNEAQQAEADETAGQPNQATSDLQQAALAIADGAQRGSIAPDEAATLESDLSAFASALGLAAAATPPATTPATPGGPAGGPAQTGQGDGPGGSGSGDGHGHGNGNG